jgi:beta-lactamase class A
VSRWVRRRRWLAALALVFCSLMVIPASVQAQVARIESAGRQLVLLFNQKVEPDQLFTPEFLARVPAAQLKDITRTVRDQLGAAIAAEIVGPHDPLGAALTLRFERGSAQLRIALDPTTPHLLRGLLVSGTQRMDDSLAAIAAEFGALPGQASFAAARLGTASPEILVSHQPALRLAIGSAFKLFILAELSRQISTGERGWSDVVPLSHKSLPSGFLQDWPRASPMTLHSLAALMISQSDNSASDTLLHLAGRERVEALLPRLGLGNDPRNRPFLSTLEAFALKGGDTALTTRWLAADEDGKRRLLAELGRADPARIDIARLASKPNHIDQVEWFASAQELIGTMDWLRREGGEQALDILAINPGLGRPAAAPFAYLGYKGGSETGVLAMTFLVRDRKGGWHAVAGAWNDPAAPLAAARFELLMSRAIALLGR